MKCPTNASAGTLVYFTEDMVDCVCVEVDQEGASNQKAKVPT